MNGEAVAVNAVVVAGVLAVGLYISLVVWTWLAAQKLRGRSWVAFEPRRPVPWDFLVVGAAICVYVLSVLLTQYLVRAWETAEGTVAIEAAPPAAPTPDSAETARLDAPGASPKAPDAPRRRGSDHMLVVLLREYPNGWVVALCVFSAVIVAPIWEEIFFRLVWLGWLERIEARLAREVRIPARLRGVMPVVVSSLLFALVHIRFSTTQLPASRLLKGLSVHTAVSILTALLVLAMLRAAGAKAADLGWDRRRWPADAWTGLVTFAAIMVPLFLLQWGLVLWLNARGLDWVAPDPAPIFLLALALGYLYYRTHRLAAPIALHMALNATTTGLFFLTRA